MNSWTWGQVQRWTRDRQACRSLVTALWADQLEENQGSSYTRLNVFRTWTAVIRYILYANLRSSKNRNLIFYLTNSIIIYPGPENHFIFNSVQKETILFLNQKWVTEFDRRYFEWMSVVDLRSSPIARKYETTSKTTCWHLNAIYLYYWRYVQRTYYRVFD